MRIKLRLNQSGDTIVEVMLAAAVLSVVMAGAFTLTNRATRLAQSANERTEVSNLLQREAELIRAKVAQSGSTFWTTLDDPISGYYGNGYLRANPNENKDICASNSPIVDPNSFYMKTFDLVDPTNLDYLEPTSSIYADSPTLLMVDDVATDIYSVWIEAASEPVAVPTYTDFYIYACWKGIGGEGMQSSGLVMRLSR